MARPRNGKLTKKEAGFVRDYVLTGNGAQSALKNYDVKDIKVAQVIASENLTKPIIQEAVKSIAEQFSNDDLVKVHKGLLTATRLDHMVFPPFSKKEQDETSGKDDEDVESEANEGEDYGEQLTDLEIRELLESVNCTVRKIIHGETARHVYFWSADNKSRKDAIDLAYKLKGVYAPEKAISLNITANIENREKMEKIAQETADRLLDDEIK